MAMAMPLFRAQRRLQGGEPRTVLDHADGVFGKVVIGIGTFFTNHVHVPLKDDDGRLFEPFGGRDPNHQVAGDI